MSFLPAFIGILLYIAGVFAFILLIMVLFKLNKVLDIWLEQNRK